MTRILVTVLGVALAAGLVLLIMPARPTVEAPMVLAPQVSDEPKGAAQGVDHTPDKIAASTATDDREPAESMPPPMGSPTTESEEGLLSVAEPEAVEVPAQPGSLPVIEQTEDKAQDDMDQPPLREDASSSIEDPGSALPPEDFEIAIEPRLLDGSIVEV